MYCEVLQKVDGHVLQSGTNGDMMRSIGNLSFLKIDWTYGSGTWLTSRSSTSITTQPQREKDMWIYIYFEVLTKTRIQNHHDKDQDIRERKRTWQIYKSEKDKYKFVTVQLVSGNVSTTNLILHYKSLRAGSQVQHDGARLHGIKVNSNSTRTVGKTTNDHINGKERRSRIHVLNVRWQQ